MKKLPQIAKSGLRPALAQLGGGGNNVVSFILQFINITTAIIGFISLIRDFLAGRDDTA